jgi:hypothetical protein
MTLTTPIYLPYYVLINCCMPTCACTHAKLSKTSFFWGQILHPKTTFFLGRREYARYRRTRKETNTKGLHFIFLFVKTWSG